MRIGFDCRDCGIGDVVTSLWIAEGVRAAGHEAVYVSGRHDRVLAAFGYEAQPVGAEDFETPLVVFGGSSPAYRRELDLGGRGPHRGYLWQMQLPFSVEPQRPRAGQWEECDEWAQELRRARTGGTKPLAVLFPGCAYMTRTWPVQKWTRLGWWLEENGVGTAGFNSSTDGLESLPFYCYGYEIEALISIIRAADIVIANDSGPAHLAGTVGTKTLAVMGPTHPQMVFGYCPDVIPVHVAEEELACVGCHFKAERGFRSACDQGCEALHILPVDRVMRRVLAEVGA